MGAAFLMLFGIITYALQRGKRDFTSTNQVIATSYDVVVATEVAHEARRLLRSCRWPRTAACRSARDQARRPPFQQPRPAWPAAARPAAQAPERPAHGADDPYGQGTPRGQQPRASAGPPAAAARPASRCRALPGPAGRPPAVRNTPRHPDAGRPAAPQQAGPGPAGRPAAERRAREPRQPNRRRQRQGRRQRGRCGTERRSSGERPLLPSPAPTNAGAAALCASLRLGSLPAVDHAGRCRPSRTRRRRACAAGPHTG